MILIATWIAGCQPPHPETEGLTLLPNILLVTVDTLRADHMPAYGYARNTTPNISRFFQDAEVFERAYTAASYTSGSMVSMLSGLDPARHGVRDFYLHLNPSIRILPEYLSELGYRTAAVVSNTVLTEEALGISSRFDRYDDFVDERESSRQIYERRASRTSDAALLWLTGIKDVEAPHFLWLHYIDPHSPYAVPSDEITTRFRHKGQQMLEDPPLGYQRLPGIQDALNYHDRYDEEIAYVDRELGRFLAAYEQAGFLEDALLIFASDHGETLFEHQFNLEHSINIWNEVIRVPLFVRWPGSRGSRNPTPVSLTDLLATLIQRLTGEVPEELDGIPFAQRSPQDFLFQESRKRGRAAEFQAPKHSIIRGDEKWTYWIDRKGVIQPLWYTHLSSDPGEANTRAWLRGSGDISRALDKTLEAEREWSSVTNTALALPGSAPTGPKVAPTLEPHQREALRSLGYLE